MSLASTTGPSSIPSKSRSLQLISSSVEIQGKNMERFMKYCRMLNRLMMILFQFLFTNMSTPVGHFVLFPRERKMMMMNWCFYVSFNIKSYGDDERMIMDACAISTTKSWAELLSLLSNLLSSLPNVFVGDNLLMFFLSLTFPWFQQLLSPFNLHCCSGSKEWQNCTKKVSFGK